MLGANLATFLLARLHGLWIMMIRAIITIHSWGLFCKGMYLRMETSLANGSAAFLLWPSMCVLKVLGILIVLALIAIKDWTTRRWKPIASTCLTILGLWIMKSTVTECQHFCLSGKSNQKRALHYCPNKNFLT